MRIIAGKYKRRKLFTPKGIQTRPSTDRLRETLMAILEGGRFGFPLNSNLIMMSFLDRSSWNRSCIKRASK